MTKKITAAEQKALDKEYQLRIAYRNVFLPEKLERRKDAQLVLQDIIKKGYFFNDDLPLDRPDLIGKRNLVGQILNILACWDRPDKSFEAITDSLKKWPILYKARLTKNKK